MELISQDVPCRVFSDSRPARALATTEGAVAAPRPRPAPRLGVALGGGSARGYAHFGALASLERNGLVPDVIAGTSFGAVVGALYATGRPLPELLRQAESMRRRDVFPYVADFGLHRAALFQGKRLEAYFDRLLEGRSFADLEKRLVVVTTDIDSGEQVLLESGPLALALRASTAIPGVFAPALVDGRRLIDGGIGSPVPLDTLDGLDVDVAIGIGAGMEAGDSGAIRLARRVLASDGARRWQSRAAAAAPKGAVGRLGRALAFAAGGWAGAARGGAPTAGPDGAVSAAGGCRRFEVHTKPPIHWLNFHRAGEAIRAGDAALTGLVPLVITAMAQV